jgi:hypothetical protein
MNCRDECHVEVCCFGEMFVLMQCYWHSVSEKFTDCILISHKTNIRTQLIFLHITIKSHISSSVSSSSVKCISFIIHISFLADRHIKILNRNLRCQLYQLHLSQKWVTSSTESDFLKKSCNNDLKTSSNVYFNALITDM